MDEVFRGFRHFLLKVGYFCLKRALFVKTVGFFNIEKVVISPKKSIENHSA